MEGYVGFFLMLMGMGHLSSWNSQETPSVGGSKRVAAVFLYFSEGSGLVTQGKLDKISNIFILK